MQSLGVEESDKSACVRSSRTNVSRNSIVGVGASSIATVQAGDENFYECIPTASLTVGQNATASSTAKDDDEEQGSTQSLSVEEGELRRRRTACGGDQVSYKSVSYELIDTLAWHRRNQDLANGQGRNAKRCLTPFARLGSIKKEDPITNYYRESRWLSNFTIFAIAFTMSGAGYAISRSAELLLESSIKLSTRFASLPEGFVVFTCLSAFFAFAAFVPVALRPVSAGSGIAEAKAVLNGIVVPKVTDLVTALCKGISVTFASAAALPVGLEGPMIFIGLSIGDNISRFISPKYAQLRSDRERRDFAAVGTASGVTCAFFSPIGGILFAMEEGSSFWSTALTWKCFSGACAALIVSYCWIQLSNCCGSYLDLVDVAKFSGIDGQSKNYVHPTFKIWEYGVFAVMGIIGGALGACFNEMNRMLTKYRTRHQLNRCWKAVEVVGLTILMSVLAWWLPLAVFSCGDLDNVKADDKYFRQFGCPDGQYNELATLFLNPPGEVGINLLYYENATAFSPRVCMVAGVVYLFMVVIMFGTSISMGIFIPLLYVGACFGRAFAIWCTFSEVATYAIVGSVAMLAGVIQVMISITVIMMQATALPYMVTPFMVVTICAKTFSNVCFGRKGIYDIILAVNKIPFLPERPPEIVRHTRYTARSIMSPLPLVTLPRQVRVSDLLTTIKERPDPDFPVVNSTSDDTLVGSIARTDLLVLLEHKETFFARNASDDDEIRGTDLEYDELVEHYPSSLPNIDDIESQLTEADSSEFIDLSSYVQLAPYVFDELGSAERAYELFRTLGLRSLFVLGTTSRPIGVITRSDLKDLEELGPFEPDP